MIEETVPAALAGERLDRIVALVLDVSRSVAQGVVDSGGVTVDGAVETVGRLRLEEGQHVTVDESHLPGAELPAPDPEIEFGVVHVDEWIVVVDKPAGLVVHPGAGNPDGTLVNGLLAAYPDLAEVGDPVRPGIVHRLDAGSTGLLVVARTEEAREALIDQFVDHSAGRTYMALVWGRPEAPHGVIDAPIGRSQRDPMRMAVVADGRGARTEYEVLQSYDDRGEPTLLECRLETGRTHQIRVHLSSIGHPLIGDPWYGQRRPTLGLERPFLHASRLELTHPGTGERVVFESELPADLRGILDTLTPT
ncbi:MAG: RluA family pseudouridine synthase [Actinobacteria bacterium]|nr:RluA family pseudouridine synthase [Actinomycetota bacterium]